MLARTTKPSVFILVAMVAGNAVAEPIPPSAEQVAHWAHFSKPVQLGRARGEGGVLESGDAAKWGETIWVFSYKAEKETLSAYVIVLYKGGSLFGEHRSETEQRIEKESAKPEAHGPVFRKATRVEAHADGRKVFFTLLGGTPGAAMFGGFTHIGEYDLLLVRVVDQEYEMAPEQRLKDPAEPKAELWDMFRRLEEQIGKEK